MSDPCSILDLDKVTTRLSHFTSTTLHLVALAAMSLAYLDEQRVSFGDSLHVGCQHVMREQLHVFNQHAVEFISSQVCTGSNCLSSSYYSRRTVYMWTGSVCVTLPKGSPKLWERYYGSGRTVVQFNLAHLMHSISGNSQLNK